jgi:hypothetical protein
MENSGDPLAEGLGVKPAFKPALILANAPLRNTGKRPGNKYTGYRSKVEETVSDHAVAMGCSPNRHIQAMA